jgi:hypothetical protein
MLEEQIFFPSERILIFGFVIEIGNLFKVSGGETNGDGIKAIRIYQGDKSVMQMFGYHPHMSSRKEDLIKFIEKNF